MAWAGAAVAWGPTGGITIVARLALVTLSALRVVLATLILWGEDDAGTTEGSPLCPPCPPHNSTCSPGTRQSQGGTQRRAHGTDSAHRCPGRARWCCVSSPRRSPTGTGMGVGHQLHPRAVGKVGSSPGTRGRGSRGGRCILLPPVPAAGQWHGAQPHPDGHQRACGVGQDVPTALPAHPPSPGSHTPHYLLSVGCSE